MIRDITIGQYYQTKSVIHRLDPRVKLLGTLLFIIALFSYKNPLGYALGIAFLCMVIKLSHVPVKFITKGLKGILMILCITVLINLFLTAGTPLVSFWKITITYEGLAMAVTMILRLIMLIMGSSIVTLTTTPNNLTDGLEKGLGFMRVFRVPVGDVAMMMSIALRFIPILLEETDRIMKAQLARGADFENGNLVKRAKALVPVLVPLFVSAFRRAGDLAMAMEARCYRGGDGRTKMKPLVYKKRDAVAYIILFAFVVLSIWLGRWSVITGFFNNIYLNILK
jgi:energy-coupling factor transport system permease protein